VPWAALRRIEQREPREAGLDDGIEAGLALNRDGADLEHVHQR
jgi:hypothetical protein